MPLSMVSKNSSDVAKYLLFIRPRKDLSDTIVEGIQQSLNEKEIAN